MNDARGGDSCAFMLQYVQDDRNVAQAGVSSLPNERQGCHSNSVSLLDHDGGEDARELSISVQACGELEDVCPCCGERLEVGSVKVSDPSELVCSGAAPWVHVHCWNAVHPSISSFFASNTGTRGQLSAFASLPGQILQGWHDLDCMKRLALLSKVFYIHASHTVTARDVLNHYPCNSQDCSLCQLPQWCSYKPRCLHPELPALQCPVDGCCNTMHHVCQNECQASAGVEESRYTCFKHNTALQAPSSLVTAADNGAGRPRPRSRSTSRNESAPARRAASIDAQSASRGRPRTRSQTRSQSDRSQSNRTAPSNTTRRQPSTRAQHRVESSALC